MRTALLCLRDRIDSAVFTALGAVISRITRKDPPQFVLDRCYWYQEWRDAEPRWFSCDA